MKLRHRTREARKQVVQQAREAAPITPTMHPLRQLYVQQVAAGEARADFEAKLFPLSGRWGYAYPPELGYEHIYTPQPAPLAAMHRTGWLDDRSSSVSVGSDYARAVLAEYGNRTLPAYERELEGDNDRATSRGLGLVVSLDRQFVEMHTAGWQARDPFLAAGVPDFHRWSVFAWLLRLRKILLDAPASHFTDLELGQTPSVEMPDASRWLQQLGAGPMPAGRLEWRKADAAVLGKWSAAQPVAYIELPGLDRGNTKLCLVATRPVTDTSPETRPAWHLCTLTDWGHTVYPRTSYWSVLSASGTTALLRLIYSHMGWSWSRLHRPCRYRRDTPDPYPRQRKAWLSRETGGWVAEDLRTTARGDGNLAGIFGPNDTGTFIPPSGDIPQWSVVRAVHQRRTVTARAAATRAVVDADCQDILLWDNKGAIGWVPRSAVQGVLWGIETVGQQLHPGTLSAQLSKHESTSRGWVDMWRPPR